MVGIDPAEESILAAKQKPAADQVAWMTGYSDILPSRAFDLVFMTSHVAQLITSDDAWNTVLSDFSRTLASGGRLVFDTRDPADRRWERWNPIDSQRQVTLGDGRVVRAWTEVIAADASLVTFTHHYNFADGTSELASESTLRFRSLDELTVSLTKAGLAIDDVFGGFGREPLGAKDGEFLVVAKRTA